MNEAGHDADLGLAGRYHAGAVRPDEAAIVILKTRLDAHHVEHGNAFGNAHDHLDARVRGFEDRICRKGGRHVDHADIGTGLAHRRMGGIEYRHAEVLGAATPGRDPGNNLRAVIDALFGVE